MPKGRPWLPGAEPVDAPAPHTRSFREGTTALGERTQKWWGQSVLPPTTSFSGRLSAVVLWGLLLLRFLSVWLRCRSLLFFLPGTTLELWVGRRRRWVRRYLLVVPHGLPSPPSLRDCCSQLDMEHQ